MFFNDYFATDSDVWVESEHISLPWTDIQLTNLEEDTKYKIIGVAKEGKRERSSDTIYVMSLSRATITHISHGLYNYEIFSRIYLLFKLTPIIFVCLKVKNIKNKLHTYLNLTGMKLFDKLFFKIDKINFFFSESLQSAAWFIAVLCAVLLALFTAAIMCCCERQRSGKYAVKRKELERGRQVNVDEQQSVNNINYYY